MFKKLLRPVVFCGPSGVGKSTLIKMLFDEFPDKFGYSVSHTTRRPRPGEKDGKDYYFVNEKTMRQLMESGEFLETAAYSGNWYGTSRKAVEDVGKTGKMCILDIETEGVKQIKKSSFESSFIYIRTPSLAELERRLIGRGTETEESLRRRMICAKAVIEFCETPGNFDVVIENDDLTTAYRQLKEFILTQTKMNLDNE